MNRHAMLVYILLLLSKAIVEALSTTGSSALPTSLASSVQDVYKSVGCFNDPGQNSRALNETFDAADVMDIPFCLNVCNFGTYLYAGLEAGSQCFCGNVLTSGAVMQDDSYCNMSCPGNSSES